MEPLTQFVLLSVVFIVAMYVRGNNKLRPSVWSTWRSRRRGDRDGRHREEWGKPIERWRDFESIAEYHHARSQRENEAEFLDDRTWIDLHLDLVFSQVDRTRSTIGRQHLYHRLRRTPTREELYRFERLVQHFATQEEGRIAAQLLLSHLSHPDGYRLWSLCDKGKVEIPWWYWLFPFLALASVGSLVAFPLWPRAILLLLAITAVNMVLRIKLSYRVFHLLNPLKQIGPLLDSAGTVLSDPAVADILGASEIKNHLRSVKSLKSTARWAGRNLSMQNELAASAWEYLNIVFLFDAIATLLVARTLRSSGPSLLRIIELLGEVDSAISTASLRAGTPEWTVPEFTDVGNPTRLTNAWHPLLADAVPNTVVMNPGRGLIITGSNMSGKSTFLRTVGVTVVLAQTINTCPAGAYSSPWLKVRSAIGRSDDLSAGKSYYLVEVEAVLDLLKGSTTPDQHLFLFDEIFRGTNTIERLAAGEAVLSALPQDSEGQGRHLVIAATHDGELVHMLQDRYDPYHFEDTIETDGLSFDYKIRPGPARTRSAIALLEIKGIPAEIVRRARARVAQLDSMQNRSWEGA